MITDPDAVRVLCFGDSNTYGTCRREPGAEGSPTPDPAYVRLGPDRRWPGVLQRALGPGYEIIEEGLNGRTTDLDEPGRAGRNGRAYFVPCLLSHRPLDIVVVMLGTNDLKSVFDRTPRRIAEALGCYVDDVTVHATDRGGRTPVTVLVSPSPVVDTAPAYRDLVGDDPDPAVAARSRELVEHIEREASRRGALSAAAGVVAVPGDDGIHLDLASHARLGQMLATMLTEAARPLPG